MDYVFSKWVLIALSSLTFVFSDSLSAYWGKTGNKFALFAFLLASPIGYLFFALLNRKLSLGISSGIVNLFMIMGNIAIGLLVFGEILTLKQGQF